MAKGRKKIYDYNAEFNAVLELVKSGCGIKEALIKRFGYSGKSFYNNITDEQKKELLLYKTLNTNKSLYRSTKVGLCDIERFINNEY